MSLGVHFMPKKSFFPYTNKILELGTQDFLFFIPRKFHTGIGEWSEISHCLVEAVRNQALCDQNKGGLRNFTLPAKVLQNRAIVVKKNALDVSLKPRSSCTIIPSWSQLI